MTLTASEYMREVNVDRHYRDFITEHGVAYSFDHCWSPEPGYKKRVGGGPYATKEECDAAKLRALKECGYTPPRWWQYWRWGEYIPEGWKSAS